MNKTKGCLIANFATVPFNDYAAEMGSERYPLDLFLKVITVSLETMKIVKALPKLEIHQLDKEASVD